MGEDRDLLSADYRSLAEFRYQIRKFLRSSEEAARAAGLEPQQHQLLLAIKGMPEDARACVGEVAERLQIQHHSTVELIDRLEQNGYVNRKRSDRDRREVLVVVTPKGERVLRELALHHQELLRISGSGLVDALKKCMSTTVRNRKEKRNALSRSRSRSASADD
jgi:DNA-binding MarR family transcriptional regulator